MKMDDKKSLTGYKPEEVDRLVEQENNEFKNLYDQYNNELSRLFVENKRLGDEIEKEKAKKSNDFTLKEDIQKVLFDSHLEACRLMFDTEKRYQEMIKLKTGMLHEQQNKNQEIKASINKLLENIRSIIGN